MEISKSGLIFQCSVPEMK